MTTTLASTNSLLQRTYEELHLTDGRLLAAGTTSAAVGVDGDTWTEVGEWLTLAGRMGAEQVYFVGDDPVLVFASLPAAATTQDWLRAYRDAWCLARPQCVFLATPDELRVYALTQSPVESTSDAHALQPLEVVSRAADVGAQLARFERGLVDSGEVFASSEFAARDQRADRQLLRDVRLATESLIHSGLEASTAHALVERVLLVRYLEHRGVVTPDYFDGIAESGPAMWGRLLSDKPNQPILNASGAGFESVLRSRAFTLAVFARLSDDFNGDLFVVTDLEAQQVTQAHLDLLRGMLLGDTDPSRPKLFLWAYDFSIVPTSLISSMYEQFFHSATGSDPTGTHYTPPELVQYVVNEVLRPAVLEASPRVLDPSCGSGIFLVEAYRTIVRYESGRRGRRLRANELRSLLLNRISGVDINAEAVRLAAFSLYLALLSYQRPQDILQAGPLPPLIGQQGPQQPVVLVVANAFDRTPDEAAEHPIESTTTTLPWNRATFDVIVGNPPWTEPTGKVTTREDEWAREADLPVGDRSPSQAFLWRSVSMLRRGGVAGLLVSAGVIANNRTRTAAFRKTFLARVELRQIVNFSDARTLFFSKAHAPFLFVHLAAEEPALSSRFPYLMVRRSKALAATGSMSFGRMDRRVVRQSDVLARDYLWKTFAWGSHHDANLMGALELETSLGALLEKLGAEAGCGWQRGTKPAPPYIASLPELNVKSLSLWGPLDESLFAPPPTSVGFPTKEELYRGQRIVVTRRAYAGFGPSARLEQREFTFRHTAYGIPLQRLAQWQAKVILGTMLSSLGRYCLFMRAGRWGPWYDEVSQEDVLNIPVRLPDRSNPAVPAIISAVDEMRRSEQPTDLLGAADEVERERAATLLRLDRAVFDLFQLTTAQRDLIEDFHANQADFAAARRERVSSGKRVEVAAWSGRIGDLTGQEDGMGSLERYLKTFVSAWNREMTPGGELRWSVHRSEQPAILCAVFSTSSVERGPAVDAQDDEWPVVLSRLESIVDRPVSHDLFVTGVLRAVTESQMIIAKRDERRLWTSSAAREDVEATMLQVMQLQGT